MTELTAVSTFGWYTSSDYEQNLKAVSTFGWFLDAVTVTPGVQLGDKIFDKILYITQNKIFDC